MEGSSEFQMIGVPASVTPLMSFAIAENEKPDPETTVPERGEMTTDVALEPGPVYETGIFTGGFEPPPAGGGAAMRETGPPLNTVSPAALR